MTNDVDAYLQLLLQLVRTGGYAAIAFYCLSRPTSGAWARLGAAGGATAGLVSAIYAIALLQVLTSQSYGLYGFLNEHHLALLLDLVMTVGVLISLTAVVADRAGASARVQRGSSLEV